MENEQASSWTDPSVQLTEMRESLGRARQALKSDKKYRKARPKMVDNLLMETELYIKQAAGILERNPDLRGGDSFVAFKACLRVAERDMQLALRDPAVAIGTSVWQQRVKGGIKRSQERWGDRGPIHAMYERYARRRDGLGDLAKPADIYDEFFGECRDDGIDPPSTKTFGNQIAKFRTKLGLV